MPTNSPFRPGHLLTAALTVAMAVAWATACGPKTPPSSPAPSSPPVPADAAATPQNMAGFSFDPHGADFSVWIQHLKDEVYKQWIVPVSAQMGIRGHVDFEFTVERDGTMSSLRMLKSSGADSLDRAARNALASSRSLPLPHDYRSSRLTIQVTFLYNEAPGKP
jgi:TonB family protein